MNRRSFFGLIGAAIAGSTVAHALPTETPKIKAKTRVHRRRNRKNPRRDVNAIMAGWVDKGPWQYYDSITQTSPLMKVSA